MHDPMTVAFEIRNPFSRGKYKSSLVTVWHVDPERDGSDDSCGWFMRERHGDAASIDRICSLVDFDWDRVFDPNRRDPDDSDYGEPRTERPIIHTGLVKPDGMPNLSVIGIVNNLFFAAALEVFKSRDRAMAYLNAKAFEIMLFAENPCDSLRDGLVMLHGTDGYPSGNQNRDARTRRERIRGMVVAVYTWILRDIRPWYRHPRWHVWHWRFQIHPWQSLRRWLLTRCELCGGRFRKGDSVIGLFWNEPRPRWFEPFRGERGCAHMECHNKTYAVQNPARSSQWVGGEGSR